MPGRLRAGLDHPLPDREALAALADRLAAVPGVEEIEIRPQSGSIVIRHRGDFDDVVGALRRAGLPIEIPEHSPEPRDPIQATLQRVALADAAVQRLSGGRADVWSLGFSLLMLTGLIQLARGQIAGPALTVFGQAASLAMRRPPKRFL